jgi:hypothetical protein
VPEWSGRVHREGHRCPLHEQRRDHDVKRCRKEPIYCGNGDRWPSSRRLAREGKVDLAREDQRSQGWVSSNERTKATP